MKLKYLGTAAAEGIPALFCNCQTCKKTREAGARNYRSRSQALINEDLMLDFCPDTYFHLCKYGLDLSKLRYLLITHAHDDHLLPTDLHYRQNGYAYLNGDRKNDDSDFPELNIFISESSAKHIPASAINDTGMQLCIVRPFQAYTAGDYTVIPLKANHAPGYDALIYIISDGNKTMLYAHDTGIFPEETMRYLTETKPYFDFVSLDCTCMKKASSRYHMGIDGNARIKTQLLAIGCADEKTAWCCNHFSHNGECTHDEFIPIAAKEGFIVAYDGMETEI